MMFLESLPRNQRLAVVVIAGPYRTGKSFLANRLLDQSKGFEIGSTTQACTKGIWVWSQTFQVAPDLHMLLLDTEGLASTERSTNMDIKIFTISLLISSLFLYNQMGPLTEHSLEDLSLVGHLSQHIQLQSEIDYRPYFPSFYFVLRDFYHSLEGQTPKAYLEDCLQPSPGLSPETLKKNQLREAITRFFKDRDCFTIIRPVAEESKLAHIDSIDWNELKPEFRRQVTTLITSVRKKMKPKVIAGKVVNGSMLLQLAMEYCEALNRKEHMVVATAVERVIQAESRKIQDEVFSKFEAQISEHLNEEQMPFNKKELRKTIRNILKQNVKELQQELAQILSFPEILEELKKFQARVNDLIQAKEKLNYNASYHYAVNLLKKLYRGMEDVQASIDKYDAVQILEAIRRWGLMVKEYRELGKQSVCQWELFADSLTKLPPQASFIQKELIDFEQDTDDESTAIIGDEKDDMNSQAPAKSDVIDQFALNLLELFFDQTLELLHDSLNRLKITLQECQASERKLLHDRKSQESLLDLQRVQNDELVAVKHDLELKIENLLRELQSRNQEMDSLRQVKDQELKNLRKNHDKQLKDKDDEIKVLENQRAQIESQVTVSSKKVAELESEKRKEVSKIEHEIKKLEEDVEELKAKMKNKENNPYFMQVNQFFGEVKEYIEQYKLLFNTQPDSKTRRKQLFNLQKQLNDLDYQANQHEMKLKRQLDDQLRTKKEELEKEYEQKEKEVESEKAKIQTMVEKKLIQQSYLDHIISQIQESKERSMTLLESKEKQDRQTLIKSKKADEIKAEIKATQELQMSMEEKIYKLSVGNMEKHEDKKMLVILLPQIYKAMTGKQNNIKQFLSQMENEALKNKVIKLLAQNKINYK